MCAREARRIKFVMDKIELETRKARKEGAL
jgi:hypothetical protein